jgi:predicted transcriptional regulator
MLVIKEKVEDFMACGKLEIDILNSFWRLTSVDEDRDVSIQDIVDDLSSNGIERAYTTIKTVMDRLTLKSILVRYKVGKKFFYKATMTREEMAEEAVKTVAEQFFNGSYIELIRFAESKSQMLV